MCRITSEIVIFFDDGDVMNNGHLRGKQYQDLVGKYLSPKFGGKPEMWGTANKRFIQNYMNIYQEEISKNPEMSYINFRKIFLDAQNNN